MSEALAIGAALLLVLLALATSNFLHDRGATSVSRSTAPLIGGVAFLIGVLWLDALTAVMLAAAMTIFLLVLRLGFRRGLRGVRGGVPESVVAEITYPAAGTLSLAIGWGLLGDKWLAFMPIAFMAWGDGVAGLARASIWRGREASAWPSVAMLGVCLAAAALYQPYWIGAVGAVVATAGERFRPIVRNVWDDNWIIVTAPLTVMSVLGGTSA